MARELTMTQAEFQVETDYEVGEAYDPFELWEDETLPYHMTNELEKIWIAEGSKNSEVAEIELKFAKASTMAANYANECLNCAYDTLNHEELKKLKQKMIREVSQMQRLNTDYHKLTEGKSNPDYEKLMLIDSNTRAKIDYKIAELEGRQ